MPAGDAPAMAIESNGRAVTPPFNAPLNKLPWHLHLKVHAGPVIQKYINVPAIFGLCPGANTIRFHIRGAGYDFKSNPVGVYVIRRSRLVIRSSSISIARYDDKHAKLHIDMDIEPQPIDMPVSIEWDTIIPWFSSEWLRISLKYMYIKAGASRLSSDIIASVRDPAYPSKYHNPIEFKKHKVIVYKPCDYSSRLEKVITL